MMKTLLIAATAMVLAAPALAQVTTPATPITPPVSVQTPSVSAQGSIKADVQTPSVQPPSVSAQTSTKVDVFAKADADKNGGLTISEVKLHDATVTQADFDKYDADKSKALSKAEFEAWAMAKAGAKASAPGQ
jgi:hypothetical protein